MTAPTFRFVMRRTLFGEASINPPVNYDTPTDYDAPAEIEMSTFSMIVGRNGPSSLSFTVDRMSPWVWEVVRNKSTNCSVALEYFNGTNWVEPRNCRFFPLRRKMSYGSNEQVSFDCVGWPWLLKKVPIDAGAIGTLNTADELTFSGKTPGDIMQASLASRWVKGAGGSMDWGFSPTIDSLGNAWPTVLTKTISRTKSMYELLESLADDGYCDWWGQGKSICLAKPGSGYPNKTSTIALDIGRDLLSYDTEFDITEAVDIAKVYGGRANGTYFSSTYSGTVDPAFAEPFNFALSVKDDRLLTQADVDARAKATIRGGTDQRTAVLGESQWVPLVDYEPGTKIMAPKIGWNGWAEHGPLGSGGGPVGYGGPRPYSWGPGGRLPLPYSSPPGTTVEPLESVTVDTISISRKEVGGAIETSLTLNATILEDTLYLLSKMQKESEIDPDRVATLENSVPGVNGARPQLRVCAPTTVTNGSVVPYQVILKDTHGNWNTSTKAYTVPQAGLWLVSMACKGSGASARPAIHFQVNGVGQLWTGWLPSADYAGGSITSVLDLPAGATCRVVENGASYTPGNDPNGSYGSGSNFLNMTYLGPST